MAIERDYAEFSSVRVTSVDEGPWAGTKLRLMTHNSEITIMHNERPAGAVFEPHVHPEVQVYIIVKGKMELSAGDETRVLTAGDTWFIPSNVPHGARVLEDSESYQLFLPARPDFAEKYG